MLVTNNFRGQNDRKNWSQLKVSKEQVAFKGLSVESTISKAAEWSSSEIMPTIISTASCTVFRPLIIMADNKAEKEAKTTKERKDAQAAKVYAAAWQAGIAVGAVPVLVGPGKNMLSNFSDNVAHSALGHKKHFSEDVLDKRLLRNVNDIENELKHSGDEDEKALADKIAKIRRKGTPEEQTKKIAKLLMDPEKLVLDNDAKILSSNLYDDIRALSKDVLGAASEKYEWSDDELFERFEQIKRAADPKVKGSNLKKYTLTGKDHPEILLRRYFNAHPEEYQELRARIQDFKPEEIKASEVFEASATKLKERLQIPGTLEDATEHIANIRTAFGDKYLKHDVDNLGNDISKSAVKNSVERLFTAIYGEAPDVPKLPVEDKQRILRGYKEVFDDKTLTRHFNIIDKYADKVKYRAKLFGRETLNSKAVIEMLESHIPKVAGAKKVTNLLVTLLACTAVTGLVTRYLGDGLNAASKKLTGKELKTEEKKTPEELAKKKKTDKMLLAGTGAAVGLFAINRGCQRFLNKPVISNAFKQVGNFLLKPLKKIQKLAKESSKQMGKKADDSWLNQTVIMNMLLRLGITLPVGQTYNTMRCVVDEGLALTLLKWIDNSKVLKKVENVISKAINPNRIASKTRKDAKGIEFIVAQGVKNVFLIAVAMVYLNNLITGNLMKLFKKPKKDNKPEPNVRPPQVTNVAAAKLNGVSAAKPIINENVFPASMQSRLKAANKQQFVSA